MIEPAPSRMSAPPARVLLAAVLVLAIAAWLILRTYTSAAARECSALYRSARTAADTARVDTTVTRGSRAQQEPGTCGGMRSSARWQ